MKTKKRNNRKLLHVTIIAVVVMILAIPTVFAQNLQDTDTPILGSSGQKSFLDNQENVPLLGSSGQKSFLNNQGNVPLGLSSGDLSVFGAPALMSTSYTIELARWGIDGNPVNNSNGINNALVWATQQGCATIIFPKQEYIISEHHPINIHGMRNVVVDFNGATIKINTNGLQTNKIMTIEGCRDVKFINGTILGDIDTHDYTTNPGTTEGNLGIEIQGGVVDCQLDNMTVKNITGWGIVLSKGLDYTSRSHSVSKTNLQSGSINLGTGQSIADSTKISTISPIDISEFDTFEDKYFILGVDKGYSGYPYLSAKKFDVIFYDSNQTIIGSLSNQPVYKKIMIPDGIAYADFVFYQSSLPTQGDSDFNQAVIFISHHMQPSNLQITNTTIDNCRSLGMAICGGDDVTIQNCTIKNTQNLAPGYAVNFEDGWEYMNDIKFIDNIFENNPKDVVVCAGDNALFRGNRFGGWVYVWPRTTNFAFENNTFENKFTWPVSITYECSANAVSTGNTYINVGIGIKTTKPGAKVTFDNEYFSNSNIYSMSDDVELTNSTIVSDKAGAVRLSGNYRNCNVDIANGEIISSKMYNSTFAVRNVANHQLTNLYDTCTMTGSNLSTTNNTESITVKNSTITDTVFTVTTWGNAAAVDILDCNISMLSGTKPLVYLAAGKAKNITLRNNTILNQTANPLFKMFDTTYSTPKAAINLENNTFEQNKYPYIYDGVNLSSGLVNFANVNNKIVGSTEMLNPIYVGNPYFIISNTATGNTGNGTGSNTGTGGSTESNHSGSGGGGSRMAADSARSGSTATPVIKIYTKKDATAQFKKDYAKADKDAKNIVIRVINYDKVDKAALIELASLAKKNNVSIIVRFDKVGNKKVVSRININPVTVQTNIDLTVKIVGGKITLPKFAVPVEVVVQMPKGMTIEKLKINQNGKIVTNAKPWLDKAGYLHFSTTGGEIVLAN